MAKQEVVYKHVGDTGEREDIAAIEPLASGERVGQVVLRRPAENLRYRTEIDRTELEAQKYLQDSDMRWVIAGGAADGSAAGSAIPYVVWDPATGIFTISAQIVVQPLTTPGVDVQHTEVYTFTDLVPVIGNIDITSTLRSYDGANRLEVVWVTATAAALPLGAIAAITGTPPHILTITVRDDYTTTVGQVDTALTLVPPGGPGLPADGFSHTIGGNAATLIDPAALPADVIFDATFERELHIIQPAILGTFFGVPANILAEGDTLAIWYDELTDPAGVTGRRQSAAVNVNTVLPVGQLTNLTTHPERIPLAIPICKRIGDDLLFIDGTVVAGALTNSPLDTTFGVHGYLLDMVFGGGLFDDTTYFAWLAVHATTFQEAWDNFIGVMDESVSTVAAGLLGFDEAPVLAGLWGGTAASIQDAVDSIMTLLDAPNPPGASGAPVCGASKIGFDGVTTGGMITPPFDVWTGAAPARDVWEAISRLLDALYDDGLTISPGSLNIGYAGAGIFDPWAGGVSNNVQTALDTLATVLPATAAPAGSTLIGNAIIADLPDGLPAGDLQTALINLVALINRRARVDSDEIIDGHYSFLDSVVNLAGTPLMFQGYGITMEYMKSQGKTRIPREVTLGYFAEEGNNLYLSDVNDEALDLAVTIEPPSGAAAHQHQPRICVLSKDTVLATSKVSTFRYHNLAAVGAIGPTYTTHVHRVGHYATGIATNSYGAAIMYDDGNIRMWSGLDNLFEVTYTDVATGYTSGVFDRIATISSSALQQMYAVVWGGEDTNGNPIGVAYTSAAPYYISLDAGGVGANATTFPDGGLTVDLENIYVSFYDTASWLSEIGVENNAGTGPVGWTQAIAGTRKHCHSMTTDGRRIWGMITDMTPGNTTMGIIEPNLSVDLGGIGAGNWEQSYIDFGRDETAASGVVLDCCFDGFSVWYNGMIYQAGGPDMVPAVSKYPIAALAMWNTHTWVGDDFVNDRSYALKNGATDAAASLLSRGRMVFDGLNIWGIMFHGERYLYRIPYTTTFGGIL